MTDARPDPRCRIAEVLDVFKGRWKGEIIAALRQSPMRFNALRAQLPAVSARTLSESLRGLERDGVVTRTEHPDASPNVDYALSPRGQELVPLLETIDAWGEAHLGCVAACREAYDHAQNGQAGPPASA
ncbi:MAG: helix-turn-helix domain-containing protein [Planctomycetota bacterium]